MHYLTDMYHISFALVQPICMILMLAPRALKTRPRPAIARLGTQTVQVAILRCAKNHNQMMLQCALRKNYHMSSEF